MRQKVCGRSLKRHFKFIYDKCLFNFILQSLYTNYNYERNEHMLLQYSIKCPMHKYNIDPMNNQTFQSQV